MKTKKSIRKLKSPLAREMARLSRDMHKWRRRLDVLTEKVEALDYGYRMTVKEVNALHKGDMMPQAMALKSGMEARKALNDLMKDLKVTEDDLDREAESEPETGEEA